MPLRPLSASLEDCLEFIYETELKGNRARATGLARHLKVGKPAVTGSLRALAERGLVDYRPYKTVALTEGGRAAAREVLRRHEALEAFLGRILSVPPREARTTACAMEHALRGATLERLLGFIDFFAACPRARDLLAEYHSRCAIGVAPEHCRACVDGAPARIHLSDGATADEISLGDLHPGERAIVVRVEGQGAFHRRIVELGLTRGTLVEVERVAPMGDPMQVRVRGYHLSLRREDARSVVVERRKASA